MHLTRPCMLCRLSVESIRVVWSVSQAWEAVELTQGACLHLPVRGPRPYLFGSDDSGCSRTNAWRFSTFPRCRLPAFFSKASSAECPSYSIVSRRGDVEGHGYDPGFPIFWDVEALESPVTTSVSAGALNPAQSQQCEAGPRPGFQSRLRR
jgi:hypothetical protein